MEILFATKNPAKIKYYKDKIGNEDCKIYTLSEKHVDNHVEETGKTALENAIIKAKGYYEKAQITTIAIDDSLYIENIEENEQPGVKVRRIAGKELTDEEMLKHYTNLAKKYGGKLTAKWVKGVAIYNGQEIKTKEIIGQEFYIVDEISPIINKGYPLDSITIIPKENKYLSEINQMNCNNIKKESTSKKILDFIKEQI